MSSLKEEGGGGCVCVRASFPSLFFSAVRSLAAARAQFGCCWGEGVLFFWGGGLVISCFCVAFFFFFCCRVYCVAACCFFCKFCNFFWLLFLFNSVVLVCFVCGCFLNTFIVCFFSVFVVCFFCFFLRGGGGRFDFALVLLLFFLLQSCFVGVVLRVLLYQNPNIKTSDT